MAGSIEIHWFVEKRVRLLDTRGHLDLQTVKDYDEESRRIYDAATKPIHVIADVRELQTVPQLSELLKMSTLWHKRLHMFVTVGGLRQPMVKMVFTTIVSIGHLKYRDMDSVAQAQQYIASCDPSLPPIETWAPSPFRTL